ncbi:MAG: integral rane sensor signal transduction histidine kinase [Burkholderiaceae bacterium]|nr:integral rane sensor signal transduction histidine kinase [Burkholderiaceae bacterium]
MTLSRLIPSSLVARTVLLVIAVVLIAEMATLALFMGNRKVEHANKAARLVAGQIRILQVILPGVDRETHQRLSGFELGERKLQLHTDNDSVPDQKPDSDFVKKFVAALDPLLDVPAVIRLDCRESQRSLWIGFTAGEERWWLVWPLRNFEQYDIPYDMWLWLAFSLASLMLFAGLFVLSIIKPLARLAEVVNATADGRLHTAVPEGPTEVRRLAECHNAMVAQLAKADAERREMLAGLTHDLRAPLTRLRMRLALLENEDEANGLMRDADDMERIVGQCLAFLRSEDHGTRASDPLTMATAVDDELARHRDMGRQVNLNVSASAVASKVMIDRGNLQRILDNLIDNALQYGAPPVDVSLAVEQSGVVTLRIRDHGQGIPPEHRRCVLDAFVQIEPARATRGSCGLGLAIVHRIVEMCHGEMALDDAIGGGLEVIMRFPESAAHRID